MSKKIKLGDYNRLRIVKKVDFGLYLDGGDEGEILAQQANPFLLIDIVDLVDKAQNDDHHGE